MSNIIKSIFIISIVLFITGCTIPGYKTKPERLTLGFPVWFGGPSMTWTFEENINDINN